MKGFSGLGNLRPKRFSRSALFEGERPSSRWTNVPFIEVDSALNRIYIRVRVLVTFDFQKSRNDGGNDFKIGSGSLDAESGFLKDSPFRLNRDNRTTITISPLRKVQW